MKNRNLIGLIISGSAAGAVGGLFGAGGGMVLVPLLGLLTTMEDKQIFNSSIAIILPICLVTIAVSAVTDGIPWMEALPYLIGSAAGGFLAGRYGEKIPTLWLHKALGILIIWGGVKHLC